MQDKRLADRVPVDDTNALAIDSTRLPSFGPTAARTVTDARIGRAGAGARTAVVAGTLAVLAAVGVTAGVVSSGTPAHGRIPASVREVAAAVVPSHDRGVIAIATSPPGAAIFVNGELSAQTTPVTFVHVALDTPCAISLVAQGFEVASRALTLTADDPSGALSVVLQPVAPHKAH